MKKLLLLFLVLTVLGCTRDEIFIPTQQQEVTDNLAIQELVGIKLESSIISSEVKMNIKLPAPGTYRVKIRHGLNSELISQEKVTGIEGDNIFKIYTKVLKPSSYKLELSDLDHNIIGITSFSKF